MNFSQKLKELRKRNGISQENLAFAVNTTRQTISKWELEQSHPCIASVELLAKYFNISSSYFLNDDMNISYTNSEANIENIVNEIDWTKAWSSKYPILTSYQKINEIKKYTQSISDIYNQFMHEFNFNNTDTVLILKDILYKKFKSIEQKNRNTNTL